MTAPCHIEMLKGDTEQPADNEVDRERFSQRGNAELLVGRRRTSDPEKEAATGCMLFLPEISETG